MTNSNPLLSLLEIRYPMIQAGMVWVSGAKLAAASANAGILGVIGAGSMDVSLLKSHIIKAKSLTNGSLAVNVPLLYKGAQEQIEAALELGITKFITSAGSPKSFTSFLKKAHCTVGHVVSSPILAQKCEDAGVDFIIAEGFEAGGHNGREEITTLALIPQVCAKVKIPVVAAGGIGNGQAIAAVIALGAMGAQLGTRFVCAKESSAHEAFKQAILAADAGATRLCMKKLVPVRLLKNKFFEEIDALEQTCAAAETLATHLGKFRAKRGMLLGELAEGELEIGQISGLIADILPVSDIVQRLIAEYNETIQKFLSF